MTINAVFHKKIWKYQVRDLLRYWLFIPGGIAGTGIAVDALLGFTVFAGNVMLTGAALMMITAGSALVLKAMKDLSGYGKGTVNPLRPPRELVRQGAYRICRHPMFLGYDIGALGVVLLFGSPGMLFVSYPLFIVYEIYFLKKEEKIMTLRFRNAYEDYRGRVGFLVPVIIRRKKR